MSEVRLTEKQAKQIKELKQEFKEKAMKLPETSEQNNRLDGGGGPFHELGVEFQRRMQQILDEEY